MNESRQTVDAAWAQLTRRRVSEAASSGCFGPLAEMLFNALQPRVSGPDAEDALNAFCGEHVLANGGRFWRHVLNRCDTDAAVVHYVKRCFTNFRRKHAAGSLTGTTERDWFRKRLALLLREGDFRREATEAGKLYGLAGWAEGPRARGVYRGEWTEFESACRRFCGFPRQPVSERRGPYTDEQIIEGARRLLEISGRYSPAKTLARGIERYWIDVDVPEVFELADWDQPRQPPGTPLEADEIVDLALARLTERQRVVLLSYTLPKTQKVARRSGPTLSAVADRLGCSIETVRLDSEAALAAIRAVFETQTLTDQEHIACCRRLIARAEKADTP